MTRSRPITFLASAAVHTARRPRRRGLRRRWHRHRVATAGGVEDHDRAHSDCDRPGCDPQPGGRISVDSTGRTLYLFKADSRTTSACSGACAVAWPPLRTGATPAVAGGANAALVGTISRSDGAQQVTYNGHPLYLFVKDHKPGDVNGQGLTAFGAAWFAVSPDGNQISSHPTGHGSGSSSSRPTAPAPPVAKPAPPANKGIPQNNGGDGDSDNNGGPSDGDGNV